MDDFEAIKRYAKVLFPVDAQMGTVESVDAVGATVKISGGNPQVVDYPPGMSLNRGDVVFMFRPRDTSLRWTIGVVSGQRRIGLSNANLPNIGQNPGRRLWANPTVTNPGGFYDVTSGTRAVIMTIQKTFNGGTPLIVIGGYAGPTTTAATLILGLAIDDVYKESYRHYMATVNSYSIGHSIVGGGALNGAHTFSLYAAVSPANTVRVNPLEFSVVEI